MGDGRESGWLFGRLAVVVAHVTVLYFVMFVRIAGRVEETKFGNLIRSSPAALLSTHCALCLTIKGSSKTNHELTLVSQMD